MANKNSPEQMMGKIIKEMKSQNLQTEDQINSFMNGLIGKNIDEFDFDSQSMTKEEQAEELIFQALESSIDKGKDLILKAKELDPDNSDIYNFLGDLEKTPEKSIQYYEQGVQSGERKLGKKFFKENEGHFWLIIETRPYMRSLFNYASCLGLLNKDEEAIKCYFRIMELNPDDNMGVRYEMFSLSLKINAFKIIEALLKEYPDDYQAHWIYNKVLYHFKKGQYKKAEEEFEMAININRHIPRYLLGKTKLPKKLPEYITVGRADEAVAYVADNINLWEQTQGSLDFIASKI
ncbi:MAG: hypothetical protein PSV16_00430 [Flavobacterium sp.]|nr:hypothetical protein [Flavobacterium sp.]